MHRAELSGEALRVLAVLSIVTLCGLPAVAGDFFPCARAVASANGNLLQTGAAFAATPVLRIYRRPEYPDSEMADGPSDCPHPRHAGETLVSGPTRGNQSPWSDDENGSVSLE